MSRSNAHGNWPLRKASVRARPQNNPAWQAADVASIGREHKTLSPTSARPLPQSTHSPPPLDFQIPAHAGIFPSSPADQDPVESMPRGQSSGERRRESA
ncbi:hypothetical protein ACLOJK_012946 [Asimina triloba]